MSDRHFCFYLYFCYLAVQLLSATVLCELHVIPYTSYYIEDFYSFVMNTINIFIACNENISIFMSVKHE